MVITSSIADLIVPGSASVFEALQRINLNHRRLVLVVGDDGELIGLATDGDIRRWITTHPHGDLHQTAVEQVANRRITSRPVATPSHQIRELLSDKINFIPLVDDRNRPRSVVWDGSPTAEIEGRPVGEGRPVFVIAEIGTNHNGDYGRATELLHAAAASGADSAKFQLRDMPSLYRSNDPSQSFREDLGVQYTQDLVTKFQLPVDKMFELFDLTRQLEMVPICTPWDAESLRRLLEYGIGAIKIASADLTNDPLLRQAASSGLPVVASTGMSADSEIRHAVGILREHHSPIFLLHCNSAYPPPHSDLNLRYMQRLVQIADCPVGYSSHERGFHAVMAAVALGASIVEKHFTLDRKLEGIDHRVSLLPHEFSKMVAQIREVTVALGTSDPRELTQGERLNRENLAKSLVANRYLSAGDVIEATDIDVRSPGRGLQPNRLLELLGVTLQRDVDTGDFFFESDLRPIEARRHQYSFGRPWGIPVRFHDAVRLARMGEPDLLEFHFSYKDLALDPADYIPSGQPYDLVVHAPELLEGDMLLDLAASDASVRKRSREEMSRVCEQARKLRSLFYPLGKTLIVCNVGGFSEDSFLPESVRKDLYLNVADELDVIDQTDVEIIPQTMPPFPWHFGGQRFHNLFVDPAETVAFCESTGTRICFDVSHTALAANLVGADICEWVTHLGPHTAHLHIADARGTSSEGLQIGDGDVDFSALSVVLRSAAPGASFIPEIWQGHKDDGLGFWVALDELSASL